ncbi:MAG: hypothetical protein IKZ35_05345 [Clostridia bacterium]|nr:hypothetical protein [Oscillospiraceae bacterium]MBR4893384.1 hypothetical protein [Clostridia bacterium]
MFSNSPNDIYTQYERGVAFKNNINLYKTVNEAHRLFNGDQWAGLNVKNMPKPVFNLIKRVIQYKVSALKSNPTSITVSSGSLVKDDFNGDQIGIVLTKLIETIWERLKIDKKNQSGLRDAALSGDYILYFYWDSNIKTGQEYIGDINCEAVDNVNFFPGNPNVADIQRQPYIIIKVRELTSNLKKEAIKNGCTREEAELILPDSDDFYSAGDMSKIELEGLDKTTALIKFYKNEDGTVLFKKVTKNVVIKDETNTRLTLYPIAFMNWEERKNCVHGLSEVYGLKPNQLFINKAFAQAMLNSMLFSFPKMIYDNSRVKKPTNTIGGVISVNGNTEGAVKYLNPPSVSSDLFRLIDLTISYTKEMMGVNDASLGNVSTNNTSAFIAVREASNVPLDSIRLRFYQMIEDMGRIIMDFISSYYKTGRLISYDDNGKKVITTIDFSKLKDNVLNLRVDAGPSSQFSELTSIETLDKLLMAEKISFTQYLERIPDGYLPSKEKLIEENKINGGILNE